MNRTDILKKCVDRGVAGEAEVGAVSHLFYVYLLSALQRGQRVEVPKFGTFGTRIAGVKKVRKIPYFEPEPDLAHKVNERFENLKYLVTGRYEPVPVSGDAVYTGKEVPYDALTEQGKETVTDTSRDVTMDEYQASLAGGLTTPQEENVMPRLNLKDEGGMEPEPTPPEPERQVPPPPPRLHELEPTERATPLWLIAALVVLLLGAAVFALNYFNVVHLWGKKAPTVTMTEQFPEPAPAVPETTPAQPGVAGEQPAETTPTPEATPTPGGKGAGKKPAAAGKGARPTGAGTTGAAATGAGTTGGGAAPGTTGQPPTAAQGAPSSGSGNYTLQVSSWVSRRKAEREAAKLTSAGFDAYVVDVDLNGEAWHRVRVGRFATKGEARGTVEKLQNVVDVPPFIARYER